MDYKFLPENSKTLLKEIVLSSNPTEMLCEKLRNASTSEADEIRGIIHELVENKYIQVYWADDKPYSVTLSNSARTYEEQEAKYEEMLKKSASASISIGDNNKIKKSTIGNTVLGVTDESKTKDNFNNKHPVITAILISMGVGLILMFSFWGKLVGFIESWF